MLFVVVILKTMCKLDKQPWKNKGMLDYVSYES